MMEIVVENFNWYFIGKAHELWGDTREAIAEPLPHGWQGKADPLNYWQGVKVTDKAGNTIAFAFDTREGGFTEEREETGPMIFMGPVWVNGEMVGESLLPDPRAWKPLKAEINPCQLCGADARAKKNFDGTIYVIDCSECPAHVEAGKWIGAKMLWQGRVFWDELVT